MNIVSFCVLTMFSMQLIRGKSTEVNEWKQSKGLCKACYKQIQDSANDNSFHKCYKVVGFMKNFENARRYCQKQNSQLAKIETDLERKVFECIVSKSSLNQYLPRNIFIGLHAKSPDKRKYVWQDGSPLEWNNWAENQPSQDNEFCVESAPSFGWQWNNVGCKVPKYFACYTECKEIDGKYSCVVPGVPSTSSSITNETTTTFNSTSDSQSTSTMPNTSLSGTTFTTRTSLSKTTKAKKGPQLLQHTSKDNINIHELTKVEKQKSQSYYPGKSLTQVIKGTNEISFELESTEKFNFTTKILIPQTYVIAMRIKHTNKLYEEVPLGSMLEILPEERIANISLTFVLTFDQEEASHVLETENKRHDRSFRLQKLDKKCVFWNETSRTFSTFGLEILDQGNKFIKCRSNHTTIFAALLTATGFVVPFQAQVLTYLCSAVSIISLVLTLVILLRVRKRIRNDRTVVQLNLSTALLIFHLANTFHDLALLNHGACEIVAVTMHFAILSSAFWMLVEGLNLFMKTTDLALVSISHRKRNLVMFLFAWGTPAMVVLCSAILGFIEHRYIEEDELHHYRKCWLGSDDILYATAVAPISMTIIINFFILIRVGIFIFKMSKQTESFKPTAERHGSSSAVIVDLPHLKAAMRATVLLIPILSVPWCLFFLAETGIVFLYLTIVVNGLQGFFVLLVYCVSSKEVRNASIGAWNKTSVGKRISITKNRHIQVSSSIDSGVGTTTHMMPPQSIKVTTT